MLWRILSEHGVRERLLRSLKALYEGGRARAKLGGMESQRFRAYKRLRARMYMYCSHDPMSLSQCGEGSKECVREVTPSTGTIYRHILMCVDDIVTMAEMKEALQPMWRQ